LIISRITITPDYNLIDTIIKYINEGFYMPEVLFPLDVSVLSSNALCEYVRKEYFPRETLRCRLFYRGLHDLYKININNEVYFFKIYRQGLRSIKEIQSEIDLLIYLKKSEIQVAYPVNKRDGTFLGQFKTVNGIRYGVLYSSAGTYDFGQVDESAELNAQLGNYIASIHKAWDKCDYVINRRALNINLFIENSMNAIREFYNIHNFDIDFLQEIAEKISVKFANLAIEKPLYGMCHGDFYGGNIRIDANGSPILFDFDFCGNGWRAYDISMYAYPFSMGCDKAKLKDRERRKNEFLNGYNQVRTMTDNEIKSIAYFIPFRRIFNIGTLYISYLPDTWGDSLVIRNVDDDIQNLKKWIDLNPIF
jgi:Ser/Thr protein kinase RdoA (MazF antagonist)